MLSADPTKSVSARQNVLLLGISYPCVPTQMAKHRFADDVLTCKQPSVDQAVECVLRGILTEMDARDLARCVATEQATNTQVYTVSREIGAEYKSDRHVHCDFNARNFCQTLKTQFGKDVQFSQVILDYYWMPTGWLVTRWAKTLFQQTLPDLVRHRMLTFPSKRKSNRRGNGPPYDIDEGVVFLPFCAHVCKELVGAVHILKDYYEISFLNKKDLHGHSLWKGTMEIDADVMQGRLGKRLDQEEIYCTFRPKDIYESMEDPHVRKSEVMRILLAIENYDDIRMVRLRPLRQHEPANVFRQRLYDHENETGGFKGLDFELSKRLMAEMKKGGRKKGTPVIEEEKKEDDTRLPKKKCSVSPKKKATKKEAIKPGKKKRVRPFSSRKSFWKGTVCADIESPDPEELIRFQFFPGPARDLTTYIEPEEMAAGDEKQLRNERKKAASKKKLESDGPLAEQSRKSLQPKVAVEGTEYLAFNPRQPPMNQCDNFPAAWQISQNTSDESTRFWELDWTVVPEDDGDPVECPTLANALDVKAASNLYHCILKGLQTRNRQVDGTERVARVDLEGRTETACYAIDKNQTDYQNITGYKVESAEVLAAAMAEAEIPLRAIIEAFHGSWEQLLDVDDRIWLAKVATSSQRTISYEIKVADGSVREVLVDRVQNLNSIIRWLLFDQKDEDDPSGCFRIIKARLFETIPKLIDDPIGKQAWEIESQLNTEIKDISLNVVQLKLESKAFKDADLHHSLEAFLGLVLPPIMENGDAASALLYLRKEIEQQRAELLQNVTTWLDSGKESDDPSGEFRQVSMLPLGRSVAASDVVDKTKEERASEICARVASLRNVISYFEYERAGVRTTSTSSSLQEQQHCPHKTMDPIEHELFDSLAMLHSSGSVPLSVKAPSNFCHSTKEMRNSFSRKISRMHDVSSPLVQNTTSATSKSVDSSSAVNIRGQECPDLCAPSLLVQNSNGVSLEPSRPPRVSPNSGLLDAGQSEDHSSSSSSPKKQENEATSTASHAPPLAEPCVDAEQDACSSAQQHSTPSKDSILTLDSDSEEAEAAVVTEDSSTTDVFSEASRKCGKRKHKGSDSLSTTLPDSPVAEVSTTLEQDSGKKSINERKKKNLFSVSVLEESAQKKRKVESEFQSEIPVTKRIGINERWQEEKQHSSPRIIPPSKAGVIPKEVPGIVVLEPNNAIPQTTLKTISTTESRKRVNHQMFDILGRLRNRDDALDSFVRAAGTTREEYNSWMECFSRSHGPHRAALLDRVCRWFGSNRQFAESSWERTIFELLNQHVVGQENSERAVMIEYVMFTLQERIDEFKGSTANGCLKETLSRHIQNLISSHNPTTNPIHFPLPPPTGRIVTPREQVITSYATCQPLIHRAHDSMDHFSSPQLVGVNPDNISDIHS